MSGFPGYVRLQGPEQLAIGQYLSVRSPGDYHRWHVIVVTLRQGQPWDSQMPTVAYVNYGKWVADCYWCKKGMLTRPDWGIACCGECGARYAAGMVQFPSDAAVIERLLLVRPNRDNQHWDNKQTAADLERENREELQLC